MLGLRDRLERRHRYASETAGLAATRATALKLWSFMMLPPVKHRIPWLRRKLVGVDVELRGRRYRLVFSDRSDAVALHGIFAREEYDIRPAELPTTYVDLGAHCGLSVLFFRDVFPDARILAVEPDPATFERLRENVGHLPGIRLLHCAVGASEGVAWLDVSGESWASRLSQDAQGVRVPLRQLDALLLDEDVDPETAVLKIDIEGAEWCVLSGVGQPLKFLAVVGEFHPELAPVSADRFFAIFEGFDVKRSARTNAFTASRVSR